MNMWLFAYLLPGTLWALWAAGYMPESTIRGIHYLMLLALILLWPAFIVIALAQLWQGRRRG